MTEPMITVATVIYAFLICCWFISSGLLPSGARTGRAGRGHGAGAVGISLVQMIGDKAWNSAAASRSSPAR